MHEDMLEDSDDEKKMPRFQTKLTPIHEEES